MSLTNDQKKLDELSQIADVRPVSGSVSYPGILEKAGAKSSDLLIAVTDSDETNMVACQVAYSMFNLPKRIARLDSEAYLSPLWSTLYNESNLPIDLIISPEKAIASAIYRLLKVPGSSEYLPFFDERLYLLAFRCTAACPLLKTPLEQLSMVAPELEVSFLSIVREGRGFIPKGTDAFEAGDEVYFLVVKEKIDNAVHAFDMEKPVVERVVIFGGGQIALNLARKLESDDTILSCKIIEENQQEARKLARELNNTVIINGPMLNDTILEEAAIGHTDMAVARYPDRIRIICWCRCLPDKAAPLRSSRWLIPRLTTLWSTTSGTISWCTAAAVTISSLLKEILPQSHRICLFSWARLWRKYGLLK